MEQKIYIDVGYYIILIYMCGGKYKLFHVALLMVIFIGGNSFFINPCEAESIINLPDKSLEGLPDLIIEDIILSGADPPGSIYFYALVKNSGDETTDEYIEMNILVTRQFLGIFPTEVIISDETEFFVDGGIKPGKTIKLNLLHNSALPDFGFYRFRCTVNPNKTIQEYRYYNNGYSELQFTIFDLWFSKGMFDSLFDL
ncbi:MAG: hypothetical protein KKG04_07690 [Candidatus Thermoplasmatota archaeon]|nr:hypothetical protein [Candidatus Thermoplasmatota archaeon]